MTDSPRIPGVNVRIMGGKLIGKPWGDQRFIGGQPQKDARHLPFGPVPALSRETRDRPLAGGESACLFCGRRALRPAESRRVPTGRTSLQVLHRSSGLSHFSI